MEPSLESLETAIAPATKDSLVSTVKSNLYVNMGLTI